MGKTTCEGALVALAVLAHLIVMVWCGVHGVFTPTVIACVAVAAVKFHDWREARDSRVGS